MQLPGQKVLYTRFGVHLIPDRLQILQYVEEKRRKEEDQKLISADPAQTKA